MLAIIHRIGKLTSLFALSLLCSSCCIDIPQKRVVAGEYAVYTSMSDCGPGRIDKLSLILEGPSYFFGHKTGTRKRQILYGRLVPERLKLQWVDDHHLVVDCYCNEDAIFYKVTQWQGVSISYNVRGFREPLEPR